MRYIFLLSGDYIDLGTEEAITLFNIKKYKIAGRLLISGLMENSDEKLIKRLSLTKGIYKFLFECKVNQLIKIMEKYDWDSIYNDNFCLRIYNFDDNKNNHNNEKSIIKSINEKHNKKRNKNKNYSEKNLAGYIWSSLQNPKVNLENPKTKVELFFIKHKVYGGLLIKENNEDFESRKAHLRPFPHPSSLHPKLARAFVNITGIEEGTLLDPFCGTGGFLIEAGLMGIKIIGCDISKNMAKGCKENLNHFKIKNYRIINQNALNIKKKADYVVTDLPYGLNSNVYLQYNKRSLKKFDNKINLKIKTNKKDAIKNLERFYLRFLTKLRKILKNKAIIIFPSYVDYRRLLKAAKFKIDKEFSIYVHRSLTRKIVKIG